MRAYDIGYMLFGAGLVLLFRMILAWDEARTAAREAQERLDEAIPQPNPEYADHYMTREAKRVELPLEERSVPGVVVVNNNVLRGARAE